MAQQTDIVLILGSGPNAPQAKAWPRAYFDRIVAINNAWQIREDWDDLVFPEDFPADRRPQNVLPSQRLVQADQFVPTQNAYGGFVYAGGTMAFTTAYWALQALRPKVMAFLGCDMVYPKAGPTHFYGTGAADPLRADITLQDLGAKSARLGTLAAAQGCCCVNLSSEPSELMFQRAKASDLREAAFVLPEIRGMDAVLKREDDLGYFVATGRYWERDFGFDAQELAGLDAAWRALWSAGCGMTCAA